MPVKQGSAVRKYGKVFGQGKKTAKTIRVGLYARVSTQDQQTLPMQNRAMREYAVRRGWTNAMQVKEVGSGASQRQMREKLIDAAIKAPNATNCQNWAFGIIQRPESILVKRLDTVFYAYFDAIR